jgi:tetratricopeptide (TPR) repeat protein/predicted Ser/Thr protein kinase
MTEPVRRRIQRFEIVEHLGTGGMGAVYRAYDPQLERDVALKLLVDAKVSSELSPDDTIDLRGDLRGDSPNRDDLLREARMMAKLSHSNVLPVYEVGLSDGAVFVVMEHIDGQDLQAWLAEPRSTPEILEVFAKAGAGLAAAHGRGIVHRDFKPANVLLGRDGRVCVADFGLSKLAARPTGMIQIDDGRGTPRYMAPELWRGMSATTRSDVYAFCSALDHALGGELSEPHETRERRWRERGLPPELRAAIVGGLDEEPAARPGLATVLAGLAGRPPRSSWWLAGGAATVALTGLVAVLALRGGDPEPISCELDPARFVRWDQGRRAAVAVVLARQPANQRVTPAGVLAQLDQIQRALEHEARAACIGRRDGQLTDAQATARESCLERRVLELGAVADRLVAAPRTLRRSLRLAARTPNASECTELVASTLPADAAVAALYTRWVASEELGVPEHSQEHARVLVELEQDARRRGELELAARVAHGIALELRFQDKVAAADEALQRGYRDALEVKSDALALVLLLERSKLAAERNDAAQATSLAELARALAEKPTITTLLRARVQLELGRAEHKRGQYKPAIERLRHALKLAESATPRDPMVETDLRFTLGAALHRLTLVEPAYGPVGAKTAHETLAFVEAEYGSRDPNHGVALNLAAMAMRANNDVRTAVAFRRRALDNMLANLPPENSHVTLQRADLAGDLYALGELEAARREMIEVLAQVEHNQPVRAYRAHYLGFLAVITHELGDFDEGIRLAEHARDEHMSQRGKAHPDTLAVSLHIIGLELEAGQLDQAERHITTIEEIYRERRETTPVEHAVLRFYRAYLALSRGKSVEAEAMARDSVAALDELEGTDWDRLTARIVLGDAMLAQAKWTEARAAFEAALELARKAQAKPDVLAMFEVKLALAAVGLAEPNAEQRLRAGRETLARYPNQLTTRKQADDVLARRR